ncbi:hypothetical protein COS64_00940 [archaeon CG06_land_8_20_14_3_00_37_11]|nr:MAG: hypothetical protein COS64_00940 [archaeon CG06_land_8_20_14_3_00_37_11]
MKRKSQIEITNIMFMHLIGLVGILTFTFLFVSLISGSSSRAEGLKEETLYYNFGRRLISTSDCFAYNHMETYYDGVSFTSLARVKPGIIDMSKIFNYANQNCLRYDLVSGAVFGTPDTPQASFPILIYEITVKDLQTDEIYETKNDAYQILEQGRVFTICSPTNCQSDCLYDCNDIRKYEEDESSVNVESSSLQCAEGVEDIPTTATPAVNCWTDAFNDVRRMVEPYKGSLEIDCSLPSGFVGTELEYGNVFETNVQYAVTLRYTQGYKEFTEHPGIFNVKFCVIKIPTYCDPFFEGVETPNIYGEFGGLEVYNPTACDMEGIPKV